MCLPTKTTGSPSSTFDSETSQDTEKQLLKQERSIFSAILDTKETVVAGRACFEMKIETEGKQAERREWGLQAAPRRCISLRIAILRARNVTLGTFHDFIDIPDPYVTLKIEHSAEGFAKTKTIDNEKFPVWNDTFHFHLDSQEDNVLEIGLWDEDYNADDQVGDIVSFNLNDLPLGKVINRTFTFSKSELDVKFEATEVQEATDMRYSKELCEEETSFLEKRRAFVFQAMQRVLGDRAPQTLDEVPNIAVLGSGGGYRATTGFTAACRALEDMHVIDCVTYLTGLSGSAWGLSMIYAKMEENKLCAEKTQSHIREYLSWGPWSVLTPFKIMSYVKAMMKKLHDGQPVSFTDVYGQIVGTHLMGNDKDNHRLSDQREKIKDGNTPLPIYTALNSKEDASAERVSEWVEFTPYEVGMQKYGTFMKTELFGSKFFCGKLVKQYPEAPLFYLQGIWGSFYAILIQRVLEEKRRLKSATENVKKELSEFARRMSGDMQMLMRKSISSKSDDYDSDNDSKTELKMDVRILSGPVDENAEFSDSDDDAFSDAESDPTEPSPKDTRKNIFSFSSKSAEESSFVIGDRVDGNGIETPVEDRVPSEAPERKGVAVSEQKQRNRWVKAAELVMEKVPALKTRRGRAGVVHNFLRGLRLKTSKDTNVDEVYENVDAEEECSFLKENTKKQKIELIDAGLQFNSPYPPVLRPERDVDLILSFDFSARDKDSVRPFKNLKLAENWAKRNNVPFPPIDADEQFDKDGPKECYVFRHPTDPACPTVLHFPLVNKTFRKFQKPGVPRVTVEDLSKGDLPIFDDPRGSYSTFNLHYTNPIFDNLSRLVEFNTALNEGIIKECMAECVERKRNLLNHPEH